MATYARQFCCFDADDDDQAKNAMLFVLLFRDLYSQQWRQKILYLQFVRVYLTIFLNKKIVVSIYKQKRHVILILLKVDPIFSKS